MGTSIPMVTIAGILGMAFIGEDIGGFGGDPSDEMIVRWYQLGCWMYPFFRNHCSIGSDHREPWVFTGDTYNRIVKSIEDRYRLLAVWYTHSMYTVEHSRSPIVPPFYEWPEVEQFHDDDHYALLGDSLLVVPVVQEGAKSVNVVKPPGVWYDYWTGERLNGDISKPVTMFDVPVFIRGGRVVPIYETPGDSSMSTITTPLTLFIAGDENEQAEGYIYMDDGSSYHFQQGEFIHRKFTFDKGVVNSTKVDPKESKVPAILEDAYITAFTFYVLNPDNTSRVINITGLHLNLKDEWTWHDWPGASARDSEEAKAKKKQSVIILGIVIGAVVICGIGIVTGFVLAKRRNEKREVERSYPHYT
jgi:alpha-glucosidase (family GH31 glycosyl hydrolase)